ncbi:hypothetical protein [Mycolicibacterium murale]|uniref:hypothetical protein n=1 Tax=Mycolicibacterium murale TaxID=182220 RepID=UPI001875B831|nr:hypothetical protein [Mycolicibacterium murale]MCV7183332.1 hypothetical protein [Mycolicibacterium murale]
MTRLAESAPSDATVRVAALDVAHSRRRSIAIVGPFDLPPVAMLDDRFRAMAAHGAITRLPLHPSTTSTRWSVAPEGRAAVLETAPLGPGEDPAVLAARVRTTHDQHGMQIITAGDYLAIDFSHGLGEVLMINSLVDSLLGNADPTDPEMWARYRHRLSPLLVAALRTFALDPRRALALAAARNDRPAVEPATGPPASPAPTTLAVGLPAETVARVRRYRDAQLPGVSLVSLFTHALWRALADAGVPMSTVVKLPFDARRYLPEGRDTLATFSAGLDFRIEPTKGPAALQEAMTAAARSGRPVANLLIGTLMTRRELLRGAGDEPAASPTGPIHLLHSSVGVLPRKGQWPFRDPAQARMLVASDPADLNSITVTSVTTMNNLWFTAEFHRSAIDPAKVRAALDSIAEGAATDSLAVI